MLIFYALLSFLIPPLVGATLGNAEYSCDQMFQPVCGTDGLTYESECVFNNKAAKNKDLKIHYNGSCCPQIVCQDYKEELCDSQGVTHGNECLFSSAECILKKTKNVTIVVKYKGACDACKLECDELNLPVCDEFGETHSNLCKFDEFNCRLKIEGHPSRRIKHAGKCRKQARISSVAAGTRTSESAELRLNFPESPATAPKANVGGYGSENDCDVFASSENFSFEARPDGFADQQTDNKETEAVSYEENGYKPRTANDSRANASICSAELCTKKRDPICDSFNKTHLNRCLFDFAACKSFRQSGVRLEITHKGECRKTKLNIRREPARDCTKCVDEEVVEVCDNFNQTHRSICLFSHWNCERRKSNLEQRVLVHVGPCHSGSLLFNLNDEVCPSKCARNWRPVCDSHGTTHPNLCTFQMYNCKARKSNVAEVAFLAALHECKDVAAQSSPSPISTHNAEEKHVSDKLTTETQQPKQKLTTEASLVQASNFDCPEPHCENVRSAVCDNEGHVHRNPCLFAWARCLAAQEGRTLRILPDEYCILANCQSAKSENCTNEYDPVCGSDFITYPNFCLYQKAQCAQKKIEVLFKGECSACLVKPCPHLEPESDDDLFVCDQAGESKSKCEFDMLRCIYEKKFGYNITSAYEGRCCEKLETCPVDSKPVCDSNGKVYRNRCHFEVLRCRKEKIEKQILSTIIQEGLCQEVTTTTTETPSKENIDRQTSVEKTADVECLELKCVDKYEPVCGSNGKTYSSICQLEKENCRSGAEVAVAYFGRCCSMICPHEWRPVCDSDGTTHINLCEFAQHQCLSERIHHKNVTIASFEECGNDGKCDEKCPEQYSPVCAVNGVTFVNECELRKAKCLLSVHRSDLTDLPKDYDGECCKNYPCEYSFDPICDRSGRTHINNCVFHQEQCIMEKKFNKTVQKEYSGQCCNRSCEDNYQPVCDGSTTHANICQFRVKQCEAERQGRVLSLAYAGECCRVPKGGCEKSGPVCDSEAQTHANSCFFDKKKCVLEKDQKTLTMIHNGACCTIKECKNTDEPVCDSHGGTHASMCHFENTKCIHDKIHINSTLQFRYRGKCCESSCDDAWSPVCDQHGKLYTNKCHFMVKSCEIDKSSGALLLETPCSEQQKRRMLRRVRNTSGLFWP